MPGKALTTALSQILVLLFDVCYSATLINLQMPSSLHPEQALIEILKTTRLVDVKGKANHQAPDL
jgi:hypothetical protein